MHLQPSHFSFGPHQGAFYRKQFVIWPHVLIIIYRFNCAENKRTYGLLSAGIMLSNEGFVSLYSLFAFVVFFPFYGRYVSAKCPQQYVIAVLPRYAYGQGGFIGKWI